MKRIANLLVILAMGALLQGCPPPKGAEGPTEEFKGQITAAGEPVSFTPEEQAKLQVVRHGNGERFGVIVKEDGTFNVEWMPVDTYTVMLERYKAQEGGRSPIPVVENLENLVIEEGKKEYTVDLGENWKR